MIFVSICTPSCRMIKEALLIWRWAKWKVRTNMVDFQLTMLSCAVFFVFLLHSMLISVSTHPSPPPNTSWQSHRCLWWWKSHWLQCPKSSGSSPEKLHFSAMWYDVVLLMPLKKLHHVGCLKLQPLQISEGGIRCLNSLNRLDPSD